MNRHSIKSYSDHQPRTASYQGRPHLVVPLVMMVEGVHHGSDGPILYTAEELSRFAQAWDGRPVPIFHPEESGRPIPCNQPQVMEQQVVGQLFHTRWDNGKLRSEAWIDIQRCQAVHPQALEMLRRGDRMEVSTGLYSDDFYESGTWNGEEYTSIARNIRPEHLALLPGARGACSWEDGCGVRANQTGKEGSMAKTAGVFKGLGRLFGKLVENEQSFEDKARAIQTFLDSMDVPDQRMYFLEDAFDDYFVYRMRVLAGANPGNRLFKQGYSMDQNGKLELQGDPQEVREDTQYIAVTASAAAGTDQDDDKGLQPAVNTQKPEGNKEDKTMQVNAKIKKLVDGLIASKATEFGDEDREWLETLSECQLAKLEPKQNDTAEPPADAGTPKDQPAQAEPQAPAQNAALKGEQPKQNGDQITVSMDQLQKMIDAGIAANAKQTETEHLVATLVGNGCPIDKADLQAMPLGALKKLGEMYPGSTYEGRGGPRTVVNDDKNPEPMAPVVMAQADKTPQQ